MGISSEAPSGFFQRKSEAKEKRKQRSSFRVSLTRLNREEQHAAGDHNNDDVDDDDDDDDADGNERNAKAARNGQKSFRDVGGGGRGGGEGGRGGGAGEDAINERSKTKRFPFNQSIHSNNDASLGLPGDAQPGRRRVPKGASARTNTPLSMAPTSTSRATSAISVDLRKHDPRNPLSFPYR